MKIWETKWICMYMCICYNPPFPQLLTVRLIFNTPFHNWSFFLLRHPKFWLITKTNKPSYLRYTTRMYIIMFETLISSLYFRKGGRCQTRYQAEAPCDFQLVNKIIIIFVFTIITTTIMTKHDLDQPGPSPPGPAYPHQDNRPRAERQSDQDGTQEKSPGVEYGTTGVRQNWWWAWWWQWHDNMLIWCDNLNSLFPGRHNGKIAKKGKLVPSWPM